jgi:hypothetical protein
MLSLCAGPWVDMHPGHGVRDLSLARQDARPNPLCALDQSHEEASGGCFNSVTLARAEIGTQVMGA